MMSVADVSSGNYRFVPFAFQYSSGVAAHPGYAIERVQFRKAVPLMEGFERIEAYIRERGRPLTAFCACELRSPGQFTDDGFRDFNKRYVVTLEKWGVYDGTTNPVARSNVCPEIDPPIEPCFHAFSFTTIEAKASPSFVISGIAEARAGDAPYRERIVCFGETSREAMAEKVAFVVTEMEHRLGLFGFTWGDTTAAQVYTVHDFHPFVPDALIRRGAGRSGLTWHYVRPPVQMLEYEMDCRAVAREIVI
jgi:hypothetical protein